MHLTLSANPGSCTYLTIGDTGTAFHALAIIVRIVPIFTPSALGLVIQVTDVAFPTVVLNFCAVRCAARHLT
jgi:hypothetical protein